jgi:hypothetical protein
MSSLAAVANRVAPQMFRTCQEPTTVQSESAGLMAKAPAAQPAVASIQDTFQIAGPQAQGSGPHAGDCFEHPHLQKIGFRRAGADGE